MKHYVNEETKEVYAYASDGSQDEFIKDGLIPISDEELKELRKPTEAELTAQKVQEAKQYLASTDYKMTVDYFATLTDVKREILVSKRAEARITIGK